MSYTIRYTDQFERFDPLKGIIPSNPFGDHIAQIADRARRVLEGRTVAELHSAAQFIDWAIDYYIEKTCKEGESKGGELIDRSDCNDIDWFEQCSGNFSFSDNNDFVNGKYADYFAVLSLWQLIDALEWAGSIPATYPNAKANLSGAAESAIQAMQAIGIADECWMADHWQQRSEKAFSVMHKQSINATKAALQLHIKDNELRAKGIALYFSKYTDLSVQEAAKHIAKIVNRSPVTVAKWLYEANNKPKQ